MSKFVSGVLGARTSPTLMLAGGLMATAAVNIAFGYGASMAWFCSFWALNGILQGGPGGWGGVGWLVEVVWAGGPRTSDPPPPPAPTPCPTTLPPGAQALGGRAAPAS